MDERTKGRTDRITHAAPDEKTDDQIQKTGKEPSTPANRLINKIIKTNKPDTHGLL